MYRNLNAPSLGVSGRQNELIEMALTYKFEGFDIDFGQFFEQAKSRGLDYAKRFVESANIRVGGFELPVCWKANPSEFQTQLAEISQMAEMAAAIKADRCHVCVPSVTDERPYHEYFEFVRERISQIAAVLNAHSIQIALGFEAKTPESETEKVPFIVTPENLVTLMKTVNESNVGICVDLWNWHVAGGTIEQIKELDSSQIKMVRLADLPADSDLSTASVKDRLLPASTGVLASHELIEVLEQKNYNGPISAYGHPSQFEGMKPNQIISSVVDSLKQAFDPTPVADNDDTDSVDAELATSA